MAQYKTVKTYLAAIKRHNKRKETPISRRCYGGPYEGHHLTLVTAGTFPFQVGDWHGRYNESMRWVDA
jgi:hypothetical protein